ncbi:hypothetical protein NEIG_00327 [Nematocida sp. ERTm5]|nr:hypothetical protein NEIG_00327 [Nematocida sp. ERTm5]
MVTVQLIRLNSYEIIPICHLLLIGHILLPIAIYISGFTYMQIFGFLTVYYMGIFTLSLLISQVYLEYTLACLAFVWGWMCACHILSI